MEEDEVFAVPSSLGVYAESYEIVEKIGEGTFSTVYGGICRNTGMAVALKDITRTTSPQRLCNELQILDELGGKDNCIPLLRVHRNADQVVAVFPRIYGVDFVEFIKQKNMTEIRKYMYNLIRAVRHMHRHNVIHRDLKPSNFIYNAAEEEGFLIDFGLAHYEQFQQHQEKKQKQPVLFFSSIVAPSKPPGYYENDTRHPMKAPRAGTRGFRAPEVLFKSLKQTKAIDMWSVGVVFLCALTAQYPFFINGDDIDGLVEIATIFGHAEMRRAAKIYDRIWKSNIPTVAEDRTPFETVIKRLNPGLELEPEAISLLDGLLDLNYETRLTAPEALEHPFFRKMS